MKSGFDRPARRASAPMRDSVWSSSRRPSPVCRRDHQELDDADIRVSQIIGDRSTDHLAVCFRHRDMVRIVLVPASRLQLEIPLDVRQRFLLVGIGKLRSVDLIVEAAQDRLVFDRCRQLT
jgi:hypothetical protein